MARIFVLSTVLKTSDPSLQTRYTTSDISIRKDQIGSETSVLVYYADKIFQTTIGIKRALPIEYREIGSERFLACPEDRHPEVQAFWGLLQYFDIHCATVERETLQVWDAKWIRRYRPEERIDMLRILLSTPPHPYREPEIALAKSLEGYCGFSDVMIHELLIRDSYAFTIY